MDRDATFVPRIKALIDGRWHGDLPLDDDIRDRLAVCRGQRFLNRVGPKGGDFPAEPGRYHLYVSFACPWAHRTILYRKLKGLENVVGMSVLHPRWASATGWFFADTDVSTVDHVGDRNYLHEVYTAARADYTGKVTVPVLWDRKNRTIVNAESRDIIRMLNSAFDQWADASIDFYPVALRADIDSINDFVIDKVCVGVYRAGFAVTQAAYEDAVRDLFEALDSLEARLERNRFLLGDTITEADWHLFTALCRFDTAYHGALRCNLRRLIDYPALAAYTRRIHDLPGVAETVRPKQIKMHYYDAIGEINRTIQPLGPASDYRGAGHEQDD